MSVQHQIDRLIALRAAEWYENLKDGSDGSNTEFVNWLAESPRHMEAFLVVTGRGAADAQGVRIRRIRSR